MPNVLIVQSDLEERRCGARVADSRRSILMKLPNADLLTVDREKITAYLLNSGHRYGASKARFFVRFGFSLGDWERLALALREHGKQHHVSKVSETIFGTRYEVDGPLRTPDGRAPRIWKCLATGSGNGCASSYHGLSFGN